MNLNDADELKLRKLKEREAYWQSQLKTLSCHGGFNKRDARKETSSRSYFSANNWKSLTCHCSRLDLFLGFNTITSFFIFPDLDCIWYFRKKILYLFIFPTLRDTYEYYFPFLCHIKYLLFLDFLIIIFSNKFVTDNETLCKDNEVPIESVCFIVF